MILNCTGCGKELKISDLLAGKRGKCPECDLEFQIPEFEVPKEPGTSALLNMSAGGWKNSPLVGLVAVVILAIAIIIIVRRSSPEQHLAPKIMWTCEECDARFSAEATSSPRECASCGAETAYRAVYYKCKKCGAIFNLYMVKDVPMEQPEGGQQGAQAPMPMMPMMSRQHIKLSGTDEWVDTMTREGMEAMRKFRCTSCGTEGVKNIAPVKAAEVEEFLQKQGSGEK